MNTKPLVDEAAVRRLAQDEWKRSAAIRAEFASPETFAAYRVAEARGLFKVQGRPSRAAAVNTGQARADGFIAAADGSAEEAVFNFRSGASVHFSAPTAHRPSH